MASPEESLVYILTNDPGVVALCGARVFPVKLPRETSFADGTADLPALTYQLITQRSEAGAILWPHYQVTAFALSYAEAHALATAVREAVNGYEDSRVRASAYLDSRDMGDPELGSYMIPIDVRLGFL